MAELARVVSKVVGFEGAITNDLMRPDGTPQKLLDVSKIHSLGWKASTSLEDGIRLAYAWFVDHIDSVRSL